MSGRRRVMACFGAAMTAVVSLVACAAPAGSAGGLPAELLGQPGAELPRGVRVPEGMVLVGVPNQVPQRVLVGGQLHETPAAVAVLLVIGDFMTSWAALVRSMGVAVGANASLDQSTGCYPDRPLCTADATDAGGRTRLTAVWSPVPSDVTGLPVVCLTSTQEATPTDPAAPVSANVAGAFDANVDPTTGSRDRPDVGDPLSGPPPAEYSDTDQFVLLAGSELLVQYSGAGDNTFAVMLLVDVDADVVAVAAAYAAQGRFGGTAADDTVYTNTVGDTVYTETNPIGQAGGFSVSITAVDTPGRDFIYLGVGYD